MSDTNSSSAALDDARVDAAHKAALESIPNLRGSLSAIENEGLLRPAVIAILAAADAAASPSAHENAVNAVLNMRESFASNDWADGYNQALYEVRAEMSDFI